MALSERDRLPSNTCEFNSIYIYYGVRVSKMKAIAFLLGMCVSSLKREIPISKIISQEDKFSVRLVE